MKTRRILLLSKESIHLWAPLLAFAPSIFEAKLTLQPDMHFQAPLTQASLHCLLDTKSTETFEIKESKAAPR